MSARPFSWFPLAASDPVPGDPDAVQRSSERYAEVAQHIETAVDRLTTIHQSADMSARAVDAVRSKAEDLKEEVAKAESRYRAVAQALGDYARALRAAQDAAADLLAQAIAAQHTIDNATTQRAYASAAWWDLDADATDDERRRAWNRLSAARTAVSDAEVRLQQLRLQLETVVHDREAAAQAAIGVIGTATSKDRLADGWWEDWGADVARTVSSIAGTVAAVAGIAALFLGWVPILGQVLAGVAIAAGLVALAADFALAITREEDWTNVAVGLLGVATFGVGQAVARGAATFARTARSQARAAVRVSARSGNPAIRHGAQATRPAVLATRPQPTLSVRGLLNASNPGATYRAAFAASRQQVTAATGAHRWLALAGHGDLVTDAVAVQRMKEALVRPQAAALLSAPARSGHALVVTGAYVYAFDASANTVPLVQTTIDAFRPTPPAAERLGL